MITVTFNSYTNTYAVDWGRNRPIATVRHEDAIHIDNNSEALEAATLEMEERGCNIGDICPLLACKVVATLWKPH